MLNLVQLVATSNPPQEPRWATQQGGYHACRTYTLDKYYVSHINIADALMGPTYGDYTNMGQYRVMGARDE